LTTKRPRIALLAARETSPSVLYGLYDILLNVGAAYEDTIAGVVADTLLDVTIVAASREPFRCLGGILVEPHASVAEVERVDAIVVCDLYTPIDTPPRGRYPSEIEWLRREHRQGALVTSVCSGSLVLAESGLLDGRRCTGHWAYLDLFREAYPRIAFDARPILDLSSEAEGIVTAGGVTSWHDLALHLITRFCGPEHAVQTAKVYLLTRHDDGQLPFAAMRDRRNVDDAAIRAALAWVDDHVAVPNPVSAMVARSGLTPRTFARRFRAATSRRPIEFVHELRIERARQLLEAGRTAIDDVSAEVGYEDPAFFRRLFHRSTGLSPAAYRRMYAPLRPATASGGPRA
jgi:transcriptional regulator GlxA family with amidase domain